ncbi:proline-rich extensin-like protein EPR1 [Helianthus annuus]|uniref:proline-rich extensin-like protein EPR1 n=1 Tax=Helianthus annuus TaxID=4232 RepID=UPI001653392A|nr:proline-rich extensin-like protein EPR1 [Helianthus annuus]
MNSRGPGDRVQAVSLVGECEKDERDEEKVMSDPSLEKVIGLKCGDPPDRRVEELEERIVRLESKIETLSKAQSGDGVRYEEYRFKPPGEELRGCKRDESVWVDSGNKPPCRPSPFSLSPCSHPNIHISLYPTAITPLIPLPHCRSPSSLYHTAGHLSFFLTHQPPSPLLTPPLKTATLLPLPHRRPPPRRRTPAAGHLTSLTLSLTSSRRSLRHLPLLHIRRTPTTTPSPFFAGKRLLPLTIPHTLPTYPHRPPNPALSPPPTTYITPSAVNPSSPLAGHPTSSTTADHLLNPHLQPDSIWGSNFNRTIFFDLLARAILRMPGAGTSSRANKKQG